MCFQLITQISNLEWPLHTISKQTHLSELNSSQSFELLWHCKVSLWQHSFFVFLDTLCSAGWSCLAPWCVSCF